MKKKEIWRKKFFSKFSIFTHNKIFINFICHCNDLVENVKNNVLSCEERIFSLELSQKNDICLKQKSENFIFIHSKSYYNDLLKKRKKYFLRKKIFFYSYICEKTLLYSCSVK